MPKELTMTLETARKEDECSTTEGHWVDIGQLKVGTYLRGKIIATDPLYPSRFYILTENCEQNSIFLENQIELQSYFKDDNITRKCQGSDVLNPMKGCCYAYNFDRGWSRGLLERLIDQKKAEMFFFDFGMRSTVQLKKLKLLPPKFLAVPPQATLCQLHGVEDVKDQDLALKMKPFKQKTVTLCIEKVFAGDVGRVNGRESKLHVTAYMNETNINQVIKKALTEKLPSVESPPANGNCFLASTSLVVKVCHTIDPGKFFVHFKDLASQFKSLRQLLDDRCNSLPEPEKICTGHVYAICIANLWYRGKYSGTSSSVVLPGAKAFYEFFLIDEGYRQKVCTSSVRSLPKEILDYPTMAAECSLSIEPPMNKWPVSAVVAFMKMVSNRTLKMIVHSQNGTNLKVDLAQLAMPNCGSAIQSISKELASKFLFPVSDKSDPSTQLKSNSAECIPALEPNVSQQRMRPPKIPIPMPAQKPTDQEDAEVAALEFTHSNFLKHKKCVGGSVPNGVEYAMAVKFLTAQSFNGIYCHPLAYVAKFQKLNAHLQEKYGSIKPQVVRPKIGNKYAIYVGGNWIRGHVVDVEEELQYVINCIDTGQTILLTAPVTCPLVEPFDSIPPMAIRFSLNVPPKPTQLVADGIFRINELLLGSEEIFIVCQTRPKAVPFPFPVHVFFWRKTPDGTELASLNEVISNL